MLQYATRQVVKVWLLSNTKSAKLYKLKQLAEAKAIPCERVSRDYLDRLSSYATHQGIVTEVHLPPQVENLNTLLMLPSEQRQIVLVLDHIQDVQNLGACLRIANATGVAAVVMPRSHSAQLNATAAKIASGAVANTPVLRVVNTIRALKELKQAGMWIVGATESASISIYQQQNISPPIALVLGSEGGGLRQSIRNICDYLVSIPMFGTVESLNVSVAGAVLLYEIRRQWQSVT